MEMAIKGKVWVALVATLLSVVGCGDEQVQDNCPCASGKSIVIMYDSDVHCELEGDVGFAGLRDAIALPDTADVLTVSSGDFLQGGPYGALSSGGYVVEMMNSVGYDVVTLGNHEFDYGVPRLEELGHLREPYGLRVGETALSSICNERGGRQKGRFCGSAHSRCALFGELCLQG